MSVNKILVADFMAENFTEPKCVGKNVGIVKAATQQVCVFKNNQMLEKRNTQINAKHFKINRSRKQSKTKQINRM